MPGSAARRCVIVGGSGAVGAMFADLLAGAGYQVRIVDTAAPAGRSDVLRGDITAPDEALRHELEADLVLLAVPEPVALAAVDSLGETLPPETLLVDTLSVKTRFLEAVRPVSRCQVLSVNPMFAPSLGMAGRPVAAVVVRDGPRVQDLLRLMASWGGRVVEVGADEHDRLAGAAQVLTHATVLGFGLALGRLDVDMARLGAVAPPPHATLLALLARICSGTPEVYWDVQAANPHGPGVRAELAKGLRDLADLVDRDDEDGFAGALGELRRLFGEDLAEYQQRCAQIFEI
ncbi:MAG TPA: NAD(P)-binding domain-containing protein [Actinophytocola sp.]|nr:NAD(P)-binding domain-containing protein [Actinophytocola sp.]